jgi:hypothetical protein
MAHDALDHFMLAAFDEADDLNLSAAVHALEEIDFRDQCRTAIVRQATPSCVARAEPNRRQDSQSAGATSAIKLWI